MNKKRYKIYRHFRAGLALSLLFLTMGIIILISPSFIKADDADFSDNLNGTTYKDATNTTADWNLALGQINLPFSSSSLTNTWRGPAPHGNIIHGIVAADADFWTVGELGVIERYVNNQSAWSSQSSGTTQDLRDLNYAPNIPYFWAVGDGGIILKTTDGETWSSLTSGTANNLYGISATGEDTAYAVGASGTILKTTNTTTWTAQTSGVAVDLNGVSFTDSNNGIAVGDNGTILQTTDGGANWSAIASGTTENLNDVFFTGTDTIFVVGENGAILAYDGASWVILNSGTTKHLNGVFIEGNSQIVLVAGDDGTVLKTTDWGGNWTALTVGTTLDLEAIHAIDQNNYLAAGDDGLVFETADGGVNWTSSTITNQTNPLRQILYDSANELYWMVGNGGTLLKTSNETTWTTVASGVTNNLRAIDGHTNYHLLVGETAGGDTTGPILESTDGGNTWTDTNSTVEESVYDVRVLSSSTSVVVGSNGMSASTVDGGNTWNQQTLGSNNLNALDNIHVGSNNAVIVGNSGTIYYGWPGFPGWTAATSGTLQHLYDVDIVNVNLAIAVGASGTILKSTDNGQTWSAKTSGTSNDLYSVNFLNDSIGYAAGANGTILKTADSGDTWSAESQFLKQTIYNIHCPTVSACYIAGQLESNGFMQKAVFTNTYTTPKVAQSLTIDNTSGNILSATLTATQALNGQTISYQLSNDGGTTWEDVTSGTVHTFTTTGSDLRWKVTLATTDTSISPLLGSVSITYTYSTPPTAPTNTLPADNATCWNILFEGSAFSDLDSGDTKDAGQWQVRTASGNYSSSFHDSGTVSGISVTHDPSSANFDSGTVYYWRVRYRDNHNQWSDWSTETSFTAAICGRSGGTTETTPPPPVPADTTPPSLPTNINLGSDGAKVNIIWTDPPEPDFSHLEIYRDNGSGTAVNKLITSLSKGVQAYTDSSVVSQTTYRYLFKVYDSKGNNQATPAYSVYVPVPPPKLPSLQLVKKVGVNIGTKTVAQNGGVIFKTSRGGVLTRILNFFRSLIGPALAQTQYADDGATVKALDVLTYVLEYKNTGAGPAYDVYLTDDIPVGAIYKPGSIKLNNQSCTDAADNDSCFYEAKDKAKTSFRIRVKTGELSVGQTGTISFQAVVSQTASSIITNFGSLIYKESGGASVAKSTISNKVSNFIKDSTVPAPPSDVKIWSNGLVNKIYWKNAPDEDLAWTRIYRFKLDSPNIKAPTELSDDFILADVDKTGSRGEYITDYLPEQDAVIFTDDGVNPDRDKGKTFIYQFKSIDKSKNFSIPSQQYSVVIAEDTAPPGNVYDVSAQISGLEVNLKWTNPPAPDLRRIYVYRAVSQTAPPAIIKVFEALGKQNQKMTFTHSAPQFGIYYYYFRTEDVMENQGALSSPYLIEVRSAPVGEICDGIDNDQDGQIDEGELCSVGETCRSGVCQLIIPEVEEEEMVEETTEEETIEEVIEEPTEETTEQIAEEVIETTGETETGREAVAGREVVSETGEIAGTAEAGKREITEVGAGTGGVVSGPELKIISPKTGAIINKPLINIIGEFKPSVNIVLSIDQTEAVQGTTDSKGRFIFKSPAFAEGKHKIAVSSEGKIAEQNLIVDTIPPSRPSLDSVKINLVRIKEPKQESMSVTITVEGKILAEDLAELDWLEFTVLSEPAVFNFKPINHFWSFTMTVPLGAGDHLVKARLIDKAGNGSALAERGFTISWPVCADGIDNDLDGLIDFPQDPGCYSLGDPDESNILPEAAAKVVQKVQQAAPIKAAREAVVELRARPEVTKTIKKEVAPVTTAAAAVPVFSLLSILGLGIGEIPQLLIFLFFWVLEKLGFRKHPKTAGRVYHSLEKITLPLAKVKVYSVEDKKFVSSALSNFKGEYALALLPHRGNFYLQILKPAFSFPSSVITSLEDPPYFNIYRGQKITVEMPETTALTFDVPLDPFELGKEKYFKARLLNFWRKTLLFFKKINNVILAVGAAVAFISYIVVPSSFHLVIFIIYLVLSILVFFSKHIRRTPKITETKTTEKDLKKIQKEKNEAAEGTAEIKPPSKPPSAPISPPEPPATPISSPKPTQEPASAAPPPSPPPRSVKESPPAAPPGQDNNDSRPPSPPASSPPQN